MATSQEVRLLAHYWPQVIKEIHPEIDAIVMGDENTVDSLLSVWKDGDPSKRKPTEAELLVALQAVQTRQAHADAIRADILAKIGASVGTSTDGLVLDVEAKDSLLMVVLLKLEALDENGLLRPTDEWMI